MKRNEMYIRSVAKNSVFMAQLHVAINNVSKKRCHGNETMILVCCRETYGAINNSQDRLYTYNVTSWSVRVMFIPPRLS